MKAPPWPPNNVIFSSADSTTRILALCGGLLIAGSLLRANELHLVNWLTALFILAGTVYLDCGHIEISSEGISSSIRFWHWRLLEYQIVKWDEVARAEATTATSPIKAKLILARRDGKVFSYLAPRYGEAAEAFKHIATHFKGKNSTDR